MARPTYLDLLNEVRDALRLSRLSTIAAPDTYTRTLMGLLNQAIKEVERAHEWSDLHMQEEIVTVAGTQSYAIPGTVPGVKVLDVYRPGKIRVNAVAHSVFRRLTDRAGKPSRYVQKGFSTDGEALLYFWPTPDAAEALEVHVLQYSQTISDGALQIVAPTEPIALLCIAKARSERGEDGGITSDDSDGDYHSALEHAISIDMANQASGADQTFYVE